MPPFNHSDYNSILTLSTLDYTILLTLPAYSRWERMETFWILVIIADLACQCLPEYKEPKAQMDVYSEYIVRCWSGSNLGGLGCTFILTCVPYMIDNIEFGF